MCATFFCFDRHITKSLFATGLFALAVSTLTVYANGSSPSLVPSNTVDIASIQKIIVTGNVYVTIVQAPNSKILYENENDVNVLVEKLPVH